MQPSATNPRTFKSLATSVVSRFVRRPRLTVEELAALQPEQILVVRQHNQMGDMVCATPVFRALRESYPQARIGLVTAPVNREVVEHNPHLDQIFSFDQKMWRHPHRLFDFLGQIRNFRPELTFVLSSVSFSITSAAIGLASGSRYVVGAESEPFGFELSRHSFSLEMPARPELDCHSVEHSLAPLQAVGVTTDDLSTVVVPAPEQEKEADRLVESLGLKTGFWAVHPGAGKLQNIWPADRFAEVIRKATAQETDVLILHGPADAPALSALEKELAGLLDDSGNKEQGRAVVAPACAVGVAAALLKRAQKFLCNDTGVMHIAGAVGVPTVALFGPTDPQLWGPPSPAVQVIKSPSKLADSRGPEFGWMENINVQDVWTAWQALPPATDQP